MVLYGWAWLDWTFFTLITVMIFMQIHISELSELLIFSFVTYLGTYLTYIAITT